MGTYLGKVNQEMEGTQSYVLGSIEKCSGYLSWRREDSGTLPIISRYLKHSIVEVGPDLFGVATRIEPEQRRKNCKDRGFHSTYEWIFSKNHKCFPKL